MLGEVLYAEDFSLEQIESLIENSKKTGIPQEVADYLNVLEMARDWHYKNSSKKFIIDHLRAVVKDKKGKPISEYLCNKIYCDALNFFYLNNTVRKQTYRNLYAERLELAAQVAWQQQDMEAYGRNIERAAKMRQLDLEDKEQIPEKLKKRAPVIYTLNPKDVGVEEVPRYELAKIIDELDIPEREKGRAKRDAGIEERDLMSDME
jgi:hypothetical protein